MSKPPLPAHFARALALGFLMLASTACPWDSEEASAATERPALLEMDSFLTNISDPAGERFCKLTLKLAVAPAEQRDKIAEDALMMARIRDQILSLLTSKTFHELTEKQNKEAFREELRTKVTELLENAEVREVLFSEFVVQ